MVINIKAEAEDSTVVLVMPAYAAAVFYFPSKSSCSFPFLTILASDPFGAGFGHTKRHLEAIK